MAFKREVVSTTSLPADGLEGSFVGIGFNLIAKPLINPNIEDTLLAATIEGMVHDDLRVLSILTTWINVHHCRINADRMFRMMQLQASPRVRVYWAAISVWQANDRRFRRFATLYDGQRLDLLRTGTAFHLRRKGEDKRFVEGPLRVPTDVLRNRPSDVMTRIQLAKRHRGYRSRIIMGPSYRADMWALLETQPSLTPAELARRAYGSFATGWQVKKDWELLHPSRK